MKNDNLMFAVSAGIAALATGETILRLRERNAMRQRYFHERWTMERSWEQFDPRSGWELVPGFESEDYRVNRDGFRGPELSGSGTQRVICLGDSVTYGPPGEETPYPRVMERELASSDTKHPVEVINAGINAQTTTNIRFRTRRLLRYHPRVVVVFAGWNDLYEEDIRAYRDKRFPADSFWHVQDGRIVRSYLWERISGGASVRRTLALSYTADDFVPFNFEFNLRQIVAACARRKVRTALVTLPKLIPDDPDLMTTGQRAKVILPPFTGEEGVRAFLTVYRAYDAVIRRVAAETGSPLFDAEAMVNEQKRPRSTFFEDTAHLSVTGQHLLGKFIAHRLIEEKLLT